MCYMPLLLKVSEILHGGLFHYIYKVLAPSQVAQEFWTISSMCTFSFLLKHTPGVGKCPSSISWAPGTENFHDASGKTQGGHHMAEDAALKINGWSLQGGLPTSYYIVTSRVINFLNGLING